MHRAHGRAAAGDCKEDKVVQYVTVKNTAD